MTAADWLAVYAFLAPILEAGDSYVWEGDIDPDALREAWFERPAACFVAVDEQDVPIASYYLKANQPGRGDHVCNCGYAVSHSARGRGLARRMAEHSLTVARGFGFRAMQFNLVVSTNSVAVALWRKLGFTEIGVLPGAFRHRERGDVDALVFYRRLD